MAVVTARTTRVGVPRLKHIVLLMYLLLAVVVVYTRDIQLLDPHSFLRQRYLPVPWWIMVHGLTGAVALVLGVFQFSTRLRQRHLQVHRVMGRLYVAGVILAAPAALPVAIMLGPPTLVMASAIQAAAWIATTATGLYCIRAGRVAQHREWMMRSYPFAAVFIIVRAVVAIPAVQRLGEIGLVSVVWSAIAIACFLPSFLIAWRSLLVCTAVRPDRARGVSPA